MVRQINKSHERRWPTCRVGWNSPSLHSGRLAYAVAHRRSWFAYPLLPSLSPGEAREKKQRRPTCGGANPLSFALLRLPEYLAHRCVILNQFSQLAQAAQVCENWFRLRSHFFSLWTDVISLRNLCTNYYIYSRVPATSRWTVALINSRSPKVELWGLVSVCAINLTPHRWYAHCDANSWTLQTESIS